MTFTETETTELKQKLTETLVKEIVAFLNTAGGTIYVGVDDKGKVCGIDKLDENLKKTADILESQIMPDARNFVELGTKYIDYKHIIEIKIKKGDGLYYVKKYGRSAQGCYIRVGSTCRSMTEEQIEINYNKYLDTKIRITEIAGGIKRPTFQYLKLLLVEKGFNINEKTFAENFHLLTKDGVYNKMSDLLADRNEVSIKVVRFKGKRKGDGIASRNEYGGKCLVVAMKQAFDYCADVINGNRTSFRNGLRVDTPLFDRNSFREVWFNACLHNNWADGTPPAVYIYTDRLEVISTGGLPTNLTREDFFRGVSKPVNEELAKLFIRLDLMEQTGYGIPLVTQHYGKEAFEFLDFFLRVTIPFAYEIDPEEIEPINDGENEPINEPIKEVVILNDSTSYKNTTSVNEPLNEPINDGEKKNDGGNDGETTNEPINGGETKNDGGNEPINDGETKNDGGNEPINDGEKKNDGGNEPINHFVNEPVNEFRASEPINEPIQNLLDIIAEFPYWTKERFAERIGISRSTVTRTLTKLVQMGKIRRVGSNKNGHWEIVK
ncbi:MAG: putative DNA binding domain-containing protein [Bacteroidales bacterium]|nr:putative DNA binding domain-containing protein [Bacteroidales bacterium]